MHPSPCARHPEGRGHILKNTSESLLIYLTMQDAAGKARTLQGVREGGRHSSDSNHQHHTTSNTPPDQTLADRFLMRSR